MLQLAIRYFVLVFRCQLQAVCGYSVHPDGSGNHSSHCHMVRWECQDDPCMLSPCDEVMILLDDYDVNT